MHSKRLTYLCLETPREGQAAYTHVHEIIDGLRSEGWRVELITSNSGGSSAGRSMVSRIAGYTIAQARLLTRLFRSDAIYMRAHPAALPASTIAKILRIPVFQELNGKPTDIVVTYPGLAWARGILTSAYRAQLSMATHVITVTDGLRDWVIEETSQRRVTVIPNGANTQIFKPDRSPNEIAGRYVIFVGGVVAWHGIRTMLAALRDPAWPDDVRLVVVGDGVERAHLQAEAHNSKLLWLGQQPYEQVPLLIGGAIAALCIIENPGDRSAMGVAPIKLYEAMACGVPVIVTALPYMAELVVREKTGVVIPMQDAAALAAAVASLAESPTYSDELGKNGAGYVQTSASWAARAAQTASVLEKDFSAAVR